MPSGLVSYVLCGGCFRGPFRFRRMAPASSVVDDYLEELSFILGWWDSSKALCLGSTDRLLSPELVDTALASYDRPDPAACRAERG